MGALQPQASRRDLSNTRLGYLPYQTDADVVAGVFSRKASAVGRRHQLGDVIPGAAPYGTPPAIVTISWRTIRRRALIVLPVAVVHPLPNIAVHIVQTERVGFERFHRRRPLVKLGAAFPAIGEVFARFVAPPIARARPGTGGIFPLRFRGQAIDMAGARAEELGERNRVGPRDVDYRSGLAAPLVIVGIGARSFTYAQ